MTKRIDKRCEKCGIKLQNVPYSTKYCKPCAKIAHMEGVRKYFKKKKAENEKKMRW